MSPTPLLTTHLKRTCPRSSTVAFPTAVDSLSQARFDRDLGMTMESRAFNPTPWLQAFNLNHAIEVSGFQRTLYLSGQTATTAEGAAMHPGDMVAQFQAAWDNVKDVLSAAGMAPSNVIRLNMYTTDVDAFMAAAGDLVPIFAGDGVRPVSTLLGVSRLYDPAILIELEATAVA